MLLSCYVRCTGDLGGAELCQRLTKAGRSQAGGVTFGQLLGSIF